MHCFNTKCVNKLIKRMEQVQKKAHGQDKQSDDIKHVLQFSNWASN